ncbi:MAG TPA: alpha/beta hydrolase [Flavisolibacter sp.]|nr:alpha/beta hydrolase [Flavisolibacter sp.]
MPLIFLLLFVVDLIGVAYPLLAYFLWREWDHYNGSFNQGYADRCLYAALAVLLFSLVGRILIKTLISKRRKGEDEPQMFSPRRSEQLARPDGTVINIEYYGKEEGPAIIFVHGWNATIKNWYYQWRYFDSKYRLIMMDLPGLGKSTRPLNKDFSLSKLADDLHAVIQHSGAKTPVLWGHSIGGMTILTLLGKISGKPNSPSIGAAVLQHTTYTNPLRTIIFSKLMTALQKPVLEPLCWLMIALSPLLWILRWMSYLNGNSLIMTRLLTFAGTQTPQQLDFTTLLSTLAPPAVTARGVLGMFRYDVTNELPKMHLPVFIVAANKDLLTKPEASQYMFHHLPNARMTTVEPAGHQGLMERHNQVNSAVEEFIESVSS